MAERAAAANRPLRRRSRAGPRASSFFLGLTALVAVGALGVSVAAGFAFSEDVQRSLFLYVAVGQASLYLLLVALVRRGAVGRRWRDLEARIEELKISYDSIIGVLCGALDLRDNVSQGQARRLSEIASVVAWQMGLRKEEARRIEKAAILHDIGKIGVAEAVLGKPGRLTNDEWSEMKRHPELGYRMLRGIDFLSDAAEIVHSHHERHDGSGYPRGLKGDEVPLGARIFAVVDAYYAMTSHRPYRKTVPHNRAVEEIVRNSGSQFDPEVVRAFLEAERRGLLESAGRDDGQEFADEGAVSRAGALTVAGDGAPRGDS